MDHDIETFRKQMELRNYSPRSIKSYLGVMKGVLAALPNPFDNCSQQQVVINALKTFSRLVYGSPF